MYQELVHSSLLQVLDYFTDAAQLPRLPESDRRPVMRDFYRH